mmetsp:Transcript_38524/g.92060  ORF Transcript_38524/g.92060 Transcript_38524/m.92060 type:complete len:311 (+) Transcript_38524:330-1262(+)
MVPARGRRRLAGADHHLGPDGGCRRLGLRHGLPHRRQLHSAAMYTPLQCSDSRLQPARSHGCSGHGVLRGQRGPPLLEVPLRRQRLLRGRGRAAAAERAPLPRRQGRALHGEELPLRRGAAESAAAALGGRSAQHDHGEHHPVVPDHHSIHHDGGYEPLLSKPRRMHVNAVLSKSGLAVLQERRLLGPVPQQLRAGDSGGRPPADALDLRSAQYNADHNSGDHGFDDNCGPYHHCKPHNDCGNDHTCNHHRDHDDSDFDDHNYDSSDDDDSYNETRVVYFSMGELFEEQVLFCCKQQLLRERPVVCAVQE